MFTPQELEEMLLHLGRSLPTVLDVYLIGGCALGFRQLKSQTKDVDMVLLQRNDLDLLGATLKKLRFRQDTYSGFFVNYHFINHAVVFPMTKRSTFCCSCKFNR